MQTISKVSVEDMRETLANLGYHPDELKKMKKGKLKEMLSLTGGLNEILSDVIVENPDLELVEDAQTEEVKITNKKPTDPDWTDYVLTLFDVKELDNGNPKVDGLRRVAELLLGPFSIMTNVVATPTVDNSGRATVIVSLEFTKSMLRVDGAADVFSGNTDKKFAVHSVATAETRAEGRALRKAMKLTKVLAAEETYNADIDEPTGDDNRIVQTMITGLQSMCAKVNVDLHKVALQMGFDIDSPDQLTHKQGLEISKKLGQYQRKEEEIPDEVKV